MSALLFTLAVLTLQLAVHLKPSFFIHTRATTTKQEQQQQSYFIASHTSRRMSSMHTIRADSSDNHKKGGSDDPINPHDKICREYLLKFLDGSTGPKDECQGLENAYSEADCKSANDGNVDRRLIGQGSNLEDSSFLYNEKTNITDDSTDGSTDDDIPVIDDFFEEFHCCQIIERYYNERCQSEGSLASLSLLGIVSVLVLCSLFKNIIHTFHLQWLPEAGGCILVGATVGALFKASLPTQELGSFDDELFLFILLPPIIFHAALSIDKAKFKRLIFPIIMFAVFGTILSAVITGFVVRGLTTMSSLTTSIPLLDSMIYGSLISSIDPVATLSILGSMGVSDTNTLYVIVFGESILNDGVSIAMFDSLIVHLDGSSSLDWEIVWECTKYFCRVTSISIAIGVGVGIVCTIYFWALRGRHSPVLEVATFFCFALMAYYIADGIKCSGIVSIMMVGFVMDTYVRGQGLTENDLQREMLQLDSTGTTYEVSPSTPRCRFPTYSDFRIMFSGVGHISHRAKVHVGFVADVLANLMETSIFAYLGLFLFSNKQWNEIPLVLTGICSCVVSRMAMIIIISLIVNCGTFIHAQIRSIYSNEIQPQPKEYIDRDMQTILLYSGVRGAVSLALVENIPLFNKVNQHGSSFKHELKEMTMASIIFTVFFFGFSTYKSLNRQGIGRSESNTAVRRDESNMTTSLLNNQSEATFEHELSFQQE